MRAWTRKRGGRSTTDIEWMAWIAWFVNRNWQNVPLAYARLDSIEAESVLDQSSKELRALAGSARTTVDLTVSSMRREAPAICPGLSQVAVEGCIANMHRVPEDCVQITNVIIT